MKYRENLPTGCPPADAESIDNDRFVFRLVRQEQPTNDDFKSQRAKNPVAKFHGVSECQALGLSVHTTKDASEKVKKLPRFRKNRICRVKLVSGAGKIQQTGSCSFHHTWWPFANYDILANCFIEN